MVSNRNLTSRMILNLNFFRNNEFLHDVFLQNRCKKVSEVIDNAVDQHLDTCHSNYRKNAPIVELKNKVNKHENFEKATKKINDFQNFFRSEPTEKTSWRSRLSVGGKSDNYSKNRKHLSNILGKVNLRNAKNW